MNGNNYADHVSRVTCHGDEVNLLDYWHTLLRYKKMIVAIVSASSILAVVISLQMTKIYKAEALIVPVSAKGGGGGLSAITSQFGGLASLAGVSLPGGAGEAEKIMAILRSRTLTENMINRENLMPILYEKAWDAKKGAWKSDDPKKQPTMEAAVLAMRSMVTAMDDKKNKTIKITGVSEDPQLAARVVNVYLDELQRFINSNAFTMAKRNRIFIEGQLEENKQELLEAGKEINEFYRGGRVSSAEAKVDVPISRRDSELGTRKSGNTLLAMNDLGEVPNGSALPNLESRVPNPGSSPNPESPIPNSDIESILSQKSDLDKKIADTRTVKNVPQQVYLTYLMLRRELLAKVNALLTTQYEIAKIEESKEDLAFQVIDKAVPPVHKFKPKRAQICVMSFMASLFGAVFLAFFRDYLARMKSQESRARQS